MFFCFAIFWAIQYSRNLKLKYRYISIIIAVLQPPCWCYGGETFMQKDSKSKNSIPMFFCFGIFWAIRFSRNLKLLYIYGIYIYITVILRPPCWRYRGGSSTKKIDNPKIGYTCFFVLPYFQQFGSVATSNFTIYWYIYIL